MSLEKNNHIVKAFTVGNFFALSAVIFSKHITFLQGEVCKSIKSV